MSASDPIQAQIEEFTNSTFRTLLTAEKDSAELNDAVETYVQMFKNCPDLKFSRLTQFCCQHVDSMLQQDPESFPVKHTMVPLRMTQILKNYLTKRKQYSLEYIAENLPGFQESFLTQQENKEKKRKRTEQQAAANSSISDELADTFASEIGEYAADEGSAGAGAGAGASTAEESTSEPATATSAAATKKKRKIATPAAAAAAAPKKTATTSTHRDEDPENMVQTMEELMHDEFSCTTSGGAGFAPSSSDALAAAATAAAAESMALDAAPDSILPLISDPGLAIDASLFMLYNSVFNENRSNEDVTTIFTVVSQLLDAMKKYLVGPRKRV